MKWKGCPFAFESKGKLAFFCMERMVRNLLHSFANPSLVGDRR